MTRFGRVQRGRNRFQVSHFADQNHVRILTEGSAQRRTKSRRIYANFALVNVPFLIAVQKFDRIFNRDDVFRARRVHPIDHRRQGR